MIDIAIHILLRFLGYIGAVLSPSMIKKFGSVIGLFMRKLNKKRVRITFDNIQKAFPEKNVQECNQIVIDSYTNLGIVLLEVSSMYFMNDNQLISKIHFENIDIIEKLLQNGRGLVILSGHFANWELLAYSAGVYTGNSFLMVAKEQKNSYVNSAMKELRERKNNVTVPMEQAARPLISALQNNKPVALLVDQAADPHKDIILPFFNRPAVIFEAPATLCLRFNAPMIFGVPIRDKDGHYSVTLKEVPFDDLNNDRTGIEELTKRHLAMLEQEIRKNPAQWAWQHNRWKYDV